MVGKNWTFLIGVVLTLSVCLETFAQFDDSSENTGPAKADSEVEDLYDAFDKQQTETSRKAVRQQRKKESKEMGTLTDLATLSPFEDIAVIQKRFLPKTGRFEFTPSGMVTLNNPFFSNMGLGFRGAYYFAEKHGVELQYFWLSNSARDVTENLEKKRSIRTQSLTVPKNYMGAAYKWNPIYGKMTLFNKKIVPFDMYFSLGGGLTSTDEGNSEATTQLGTGQVFALSKAIAIRWDLTWNFYSADAKDEDGTKITNNQDDLFLSLGMSFYFPEAKYR